ncbi:hypothetical protein G4B88_005533 [Cannabis sativa]|uniref:K Homology domain-containing protein n=1 Tax=Cannabis sativa TaxID=3483 RepID=A0A7J6H837_CANSA|nr:hypothetical protein G4B88_005533 [Cannabis sativa]
MIVVSLSLSSQSPIQPLPFKSPTSDTFFHLLCPTSKTGALIKKGGSVIHHICDTTDARICIDDTHSSSSNERVILITSNFTMPRSKFDHLDNNNKQSNSSSPSDGESSPSCGEDGYGDGE